MLHRCDKYLPGANITCLYQVTCLYPSLAFIQASLCLALGLACGLWAGVMLGMGDASSGLLAILR
jgi:hypothetical protein